MPLSFSIGDIFSGIEFLNSVRTALASSTGSKAQYNGVVATLESLETALEELNTLDAADRKRRFIVQVIDRIKETISRFDAKLSKYKATLASDSTAKWWRTLPRKIQWQRYSQQDVNALHDELLRHASALQLHLAKVQIASGSQQRQQISTACSTLKAHIDQQQATITSQFHDTKAFIGSSIARSEATTVQKLDEFESAAQTRAADIRIDFASSVNGVRRAIQQNHELTELAADRRHKECTTLVRTHLTQAEQAAQMRMQIMIAALIEMKVILFVFLLQWARLIQQTLGSLPPRMLTQASTIFEDAHGYIFHINTQFVQSWRAFRFVLVDNFSHKPGHERIARGAYLLFDRFDSRPINQQSAFQAVFRPGRHIRQNVIFSEEEIENLNCPKCDHKNTPISSWEIQCAACGLFYRHEHNISLPRTDTITEQSMAQTTGCPPTSAILPQPPSSPKDRPSDFTRIAVETIYYWCSACNKTISGKWWFEAHKTRDHLPPIFPPSDNPATRGGSKRYFCLYADCAAKGVGFLRKSNLNRHVSMVHAQFELELIDCEYAGCHRKGKSGFGRRDKMIEHMREIHGAGIPSDPVRGAH